MDRDVSAYTIDERINQFKSLTIAHPFLKKVDEEIRRQIYIHTEDGIVFVFGPTGVGKTTIYKRLIRKLTEDCLSELESTPDRIPVLGVELESPEKGIFNWKEYYITALKALEEPLIDNKIDYGVSCVSRGKDGKLHIDAKATASPLGRAFKNALRYRKPQAYLIDEAQNLGKVRGGLHLKDQLDCIKSMANLSKVVHVLIGTYELLPFRNLSAQLTRRSSDVHFERYNANRDEDMRIFYSILSNFQSKMPLIDNSLLLDNAEFIYERSIGCVGVVKPWLDNALTRAHEDGAKSLSLRHLELTAYSVEQCTRMLSETIDGEDSLAEKEGARKELRLKLGLIPDSGNASGHPPALQKRKGRVGVRNPKRDAVGSEVNGS